MLPDARHFCDRTLSAPGSGAPALPSFSMTSAAAGTSGLTPEQISAIDAAHLWHPYSTIGAETVPPVVAVGARGAWLTLIRDGEQVEVLDAMSSWWTAIHGHGHPVLDAAMTAQLATMNHVMFGGLTHEPAARLAQLLVDITPAGLETVFFSDSGSVSVEVAVKMALQYWRGRGLPGKRRLMTWRGGYHGDTFTPMSICDPEGGMHSLWTETFWLRRCSPRRFPATTTPPTARHSRRSWPGTPPNWPPWSSSRWSRAPAGCASTIRAI